MKNWRGLYLPDGEVHLIEWMEKVNKVVDGKPTYQYHKLEAALRWVKNWRVAIDVGAHCGLWSMHLVQKFDEVLAFEPVAAHRDCLNMNVRGPDVYPVALGEKEGLISIHTSADSSGDSWVDGDGDIPMMTLDSYGFENVDFIKIDTEGHELFVIRGGEQTIKRCKPCIVVEQKPGHAQRFGVGEKDAVPLLESWGAKVRKVISGDYIMSFD